MKNTGARLHFFSLLLFMWARQAFCSNCVFTRAAPDFFLHLPSRLSRIPRVAPRVSLPPSCLTPTNATAHYNDIGSPDYYCFIFAIVNQLAMKKSVDMIEHCTYIKYIPLCTWAEKIECMAGKNFDARKLWLSWILFNVPWKVFACMDDNKARSNGCVKQEEWGIVKCGVSK